MAEVKRDMAEVKRVVRNLQFDTEGGGRIRATYEMAVERNVAVGSITGEIAVTNAELGNKEAVGSFTGEIGVAKAELGNKEAVCSSNGEISVAKAKLEKKGAAGSCTREIGVTKSKLGDMEATGSCTKEIGVSKAEAGNKGAAGSFTSEIAVTKAELVGNKDAAGSFTAQIGVVNAGEIGVTKQGVLGNREAAGTGMVTEATWVSFVFLTKPPEGSVPKATEPPVALITTERVPDSFMNILRKRRLYQRLPVKEHPRMASRFPELRALRLAETACTNNCIDLHEDVLKQDAEKGFAEVGVDFTDGVKKIFILPEQKGCAA